MLQRLLHRQPLARIKNQQPPQQIQTRLARVSVQVVERDLGAVREGEEVVDGLGFTEGGGEGLGGGTVSWDRVGFGRRRKGRREGVWDVHEENRFVGLSRGREFLGRREFCRVGLLRRNPGVRFESGEEEVSEEGFETRRTDR